MAIDITTGKFHSGSFKFVSFKEVGASLAVQQLITKDNTISQNIIIEQVVLACLTGHVYIFDGSDEAVPIFSLDGGAQDITEGHAQQSWNFSNDPIEFTRDSTTLCISAVGTFSGFIKWGWGTKMNAKK